MNSLGAFVFLGVVIAIVICAVVAFSSSSKAAGVAIDNNPLNEGEGKNETNDLCVDESQKASTDNANCEKSPLSVSSVEIEASINDMKAQIKELKDKQLSTVVKGVLLGLLLWSVISGFVGFIVFVIYANSHHSYY